MTSAPNLQGFIESMPSRYAQTFNVAAIEQHAAVAMTRGNAPVSLGIFSDAGRKGTAICVVAPDRPGLLAIISLAFVTYELDIVAAEVFTRHVGASRDEAVDLFWVQHHPPREEEPLDSMELSGLRDCLGALLQKAAREVLPEGEFGSRTPAATGTTVRFLEDTEGRFTRLELETNDRTGLLLGVCQSLFRVGVQIIGSRIKSEGGRVVGRFEIAELSHRPIERARRQQIKHAILSGTDNLPEEIVSRMVG